MEPILESPQTEGDIQTVYSIYMASFPVDEQRPWDDLLSKVRSGRIVLKIIKCDGRTVGFLTLWHLTSVDYVEHFALDSRERGAGTGTAVMSMLVRRNASKPIVLEVEPVGSTPEAAGRIRFYERCGFKLIADYDYCQPPYAPELPWVPLKLMSTQPVDAACVSAELHSAVYGATDSSRADCGVSRVAAGSDATAG